MVYYLLTKRCVHASPLVAPNAVTVQLACSSRSAFLVADQLVEMFAPAPVIVPPKSELAYLRSEPRRDLRWHIFR